MSNRVVRRTYRLSALLTLAISLLFGVGLLAPAATAAAPDVPRSAGGRVTGPEPVRSEAFDTLPGEACEFGVHLQPVVDREFAYSYYDASGRLTDQLFYGTLIDRLVNTETGASALVDVSGTAVFSYGLDGSTTIYGVGPYLAVFREGDTPGPSIRRITGVSKLIIPAEGPKRLVYAASAEDLCGRID